MSVWLGRGFLSNSNLLETLIFAAKISTDFKPLSEDLASTLERLIPLSEEIESFQGKLDFAYGDLKELVDTLFRAREVVNTCIEGVSWFQKPILTREIQRIVNDMLKFSRTELHFLQFRTLDDGGLCKTIDCFSVPVYTDLCSVLLPDKDLLGFDYPLMELKKKLRDDSVGCLVVCAPPGFGKTTLVAQLCHDILSLVLLVLRKFLRRADEAFQRACASVSVGDKMLITGRLLFNVFGGKYSGDAVKATQNSQLRTKSVETGCQT